MSEPDEESIALYEAHLANGRELSRARHAAASFTDRAHQLLLTVLGAGVMQPNDAASLDEIGRDCVRTCRALDEEVRQGTPRPERKRQRPAGQRPAPPQAEEDDLPEW